MEKTMKQKWIDSFPPTMTLWTLEHDDEKHVTLYQSKEKYPLGFSECIRSPVYHVWQDDDKWLIATTNYKLAYNKYQSVLK